MKKYLFILCPPFQGSTIIYRILSSSENISTLINNNNWAGEGQWLLKKNGYNEYLINRWNEKFSANIKKIKNCFDKYWNYNKLVLCDKSPSFIIRANEIEKYFSKFGKVYFIISIRNPYSCDFEKHSISIKNWIKYAEYQKKNLETLKNKLFISYEDFILKKDKTKNRILKFIPELKNINMNVFNINGLQNTLQSNKKINVRYATRILNKEKKNKELYSNEDLMNFFGYNFIN